MNYKIFPATITPEGKKVPLVRDWANEATNDPAVHKQWIEFFKDRIKVWGLPTGKINGLWALDIDQKDGLSGFDSLREMGVGALPQTAWQSTPSGGMHLFFSTPQDIHYPTSVNVESKLDTRGDGGFVWWYQPHFEVPMIEAPMWVWGLKKPKKEKPQVVEGTVIPMDPLQALEKFNTCIEAVKNAAQGERNHNLNIQAYLVGQIVASGAVTHDYALEELKKAAMFSGLPEREAYATIMSGLGGGVNNPLTHPFGVTAPKPAFNIPEIKRPEPRGRWTPAKTTVAQLKDYSKLKKPQLFKDWATEDIHLTSAIGGVGKTTIKLFEAVCLAQGEPFLGFECQQPGSTLFIIGEDSEAKLQAMLGRMCTQLGLFNPGNEHKLQAVLDNVWIKRAKKMKLVKEDPRTKNFTTDDENLVMIKEAIEDIKPKNIIFDPIAMFWGKESGGNDMAMALAETMQEIQECSDACVDMITHIGKDSHTKKDVSQFSGRGGTALANHSRVVRTLLKLNDNEYKELTGEELGDKTAIYCHVSKFSDGSPLLDKPFIILRDGYVFERKEIAKVKADTGETSVTKMKQLVFSYIKLKNKPISEKEITSHFYMHEPRLNKTECKAIVTSLSLEGLIEETTGDLSIDKTWWQFKS